MDVFQNAIFLAGKLVELVYDAFAALFEALKNIFGIVPDLITLVSTYLELLPEEVKSITILSFTIAFVFAIYGLVIKIVLTVVDLIL